MKGSFEFWDPNLFCDEDGSVYFYWGCSNATPVWGGVGTKTMIHIGEKIVVVEGGELTKGFDMDGELFCN